MRILLGLPFNRNRRLLSFSSVLPQFFVKQRLLVLKIARIKSWVMCSSNSSVGVKRLLILVENIQLLALALKSITLLVSGLIFGRNLRRVQDLSNLGWRLLGRDLGGSIVAYAKDIVRSVCVTSP